MEINKQLFEDILSGKLKGTFVLRNGKRFNSKYCYKNTNTYRASHPYCICCDNCYFSLKPNGMCLFTKEYGRDIIDFIPDTDMKENELTIEIPDGMCIDESKSTFEKIVFKKIDNKPRSWEEYCRQQKIKGAEGYLIDAPCANICWCYWSPYDSLSSSTWRNVLPSKELAEAFLAMMQLMSLRQAWIGDWDSTKLGNAIKLDVERNIIVTYDIYHGPLTFPTRKMALDFRNCFKDLLEVAKPLI